MKWLFFDIGATLVDESDVYKSRCEYAVKQLNITPEVFMSRVCEAAKTSSTPMMAAARSFGIDLPVWDLSLEKLYGSAYCVLSALHGKYRLGIIANQPFGTQERLDNWGIGKFFDVVMASAEAGCAKPDPEIFTVALEKAGCAPSDAFMIGDRLDNDIVPAKKLGMKTIWVRQGFSKYQVIGSENERPDLIVDSIEELTGLLE